MYNKATLIGRLGRDPETRYTAGGEAVCNFSMATDEKWKDKSGEKQERTEWHRVTCWGRMAEIAGEYLHKGSLCYIEGTIRTSKFKDKDGVERESKDINAVVLKLLGDAKTSRSDAPTGEGRQSEPERPASKPPAGNVDDFDDDIPF